MFWVRGEAIREYLEGVAPSSADARIFTHSFDKQPTK